MSGMDEDQAEEYAEQWARIRYYVKAGATDILIPYNWTAFDTCTTGTWRRLVGVAESTVLLEIPRHVRVHREQGVLTLQPITMFMQIRHLEP